MDKVKPGDTLRIPAPTWNTIIESAEDYSLRRGTGTPIDPKRFSVPTDLIKLKNTTGGSLVRGEVMEIGESLLTTLDSDYLWMTGETPAPDGTKGIAVTKFPMLENDISWCQVSGIVLCRLNVNHLQHRFADVDTGDTILQSKWHGRAEIICLEDPESTSEQNAFVRLGSMFRGPIPVIITEVGGIAPLGSGDATVLWGGIDSDPVDTITIHYTRMPGINNAAELAEAIVFWVPDEQKYVIHELQCITVEE